MRKTEKNSVAIFLAAALLTGVFAVSSPSVIDTEATEDKRDDYKQKDRYDDKNNRHDDKKDRYDDKNNRHDDKKDRHDDKKDYGYEDKDKRYDDKKDYSYDSMKNRHDDKKDYGYEDKDKRYDDKKHYSYDKDNRYGFDKEKDYSYDKMSYRHDDKRDYGYNDDYKKDHNIKDIKCENWNINGQQVERSRGDIGPSLEAAQEASNAEQQLSANPFVMGSQRDNGYGERENGFKKFIGKDIVVICNFFNGEKEELSACEKCFKAIDREQLEDIERVLAAIPEILGGPYTLEEYCEEIESGDISRIAVGIVLFAAGLDSGERTSLLDCLFPEA